MVRSMPRRSIVLLTFCLANCSSPSDPAGSTAAGGAGGGKGGAGAGGGSSGRGGAGTAATGKAPPAPATPALWRLTPRQHQNALRELLGDQLQLPAAAPDQSAGGLAAIAAGNVTTSDNEVELYEELASKSVDLVFAKADARQRLVPCAAKDVIAASCFDTFVRAFGRRAFRRPLTDAEVGRHSKLAVDSAKLMGSDWAGARAAATAILQSPKFLYRFEIGQPDPKDARRNVLTSAERAERLAFLFLDSIPDAALQEAADKDELKSADAMRVQAERLWNDPRARTMWRGFVDENYRIGDLQRSAAKVSPDLITAMREEVLRSAESLAFDENEDFLRLLNQRKTFVDASLAQHYGAAAPAGGFSRVELPAEQFRAGLFGTAAFLTLTSTSLHTSPTSRGKFVRERVLCQDVPAPPAGVNTTLPAPSTTARTTRERLQAHVSEATCAACHTFMDPIGFAFEGYDELGKIRTKENDQNVVTDGNLDGQPFKNASELANLLIARPDAASCLSRNILRHAVGYMDDKMEGDGDDQVVAHITDLFGKGKNRIRDLLVTLASSDAFVTRQREGAVQ